MTGPRSRRPSALRISHATLTSSTGSAVNDTRTVSPIPSMSRLRSEEHTSELQSRQYLVCRLLLEKQTVPDVHPEQARAAMGRRLAPPHYLDAERRALPGPGPPSVGARGQDADVLLAIGRTHFCPL